MGNCKENNGISKIDKAILEINKQTELEKEEKFIGLIIEIIVSLTLKEYYEKSNKISKIQSDWSK